MRSYGTSSSMGPSNNSMLFSSHLPTTPESGDATPTFGCYGFQRSDWHGNALSRRYHATNEKCLFPTHIAEMLSTGLLSCDCMHLSNCKKTNLNIF